MIRLWDRDTPGLNLDMDKTVPSITPYLAKNNTKGSAVIVIPGGGYTHKAKHEGMPVAFWLNSIGISAFVLDYRVAPYKYPYPILDAKRAVRYVRYNAMGWNIEEDKIGVLGFSAGGHLASAAGTHFDMGDRNSNDPIEQVSSRPDAMILCYPVITMGEYANQGSKLNLVGQAPEDGLIRYLSNENWVSDNTPPAFIWHTSNDKSVPVENSLMFASALKKNNIPFELHIFPDGRHGLGLADGYPEIAVWTKLCEKWLKSLGFINS